MLKAGHTLARELYGRETKLVWERHRHRYEVNPEVVQAIRCVEQQQSKDWRRTKHPLTVGCTPPSPR